MQNQASVSVEDAVEAMPPTIQPVQVSEDQAVVSLQKSNELQAKITELQALNASLSDKCAVAEKGKQEAEERSARAAREAAEQLLLVESRVKSLQVEIDQVRQSEVSKWKDQALGMEATLRGTKRFTVK